MGRYKGRMTPNTRDLQFPHQISLPTTQCRGDNYQRVHQLAESLSAVPGQSIAIRVPVAPFKSRLR